MSQHNNLAVINNSVVPIHILSAKEAFNSFHVNYSNASWDNKVLLVSNFLALPVSSCLLDHNLLLIKGTVGHDLGHVSLGDFITSSFGEKGAGTRWQSWEYNVNALIQKLEFGINAKTAEDVLLQIEDVTSLLGRKPVSKFEFNIAKDQIFKTQIANLKDDHNNVVSKMSDNVALLLTQLEDERKAKLEAIESLESALAEINLLKLSSHGKDLSHYVEKALFEKIVDELDQVRALHDGLTQKYLSKISKLSMSQENQRAQIKKLNDLIEIRNSEIALLSTSSHDNNSNAKIEMLNASIKLLKEDIVELLKSSIYKQKALNKYQIISEEKSKLNQKLRQRNAMLRAQLNIQVKSKLTEKTTIKKFSNKVISIIAVLTLTIASLISIYMLGIYS